MQSVSWAALRALTCALRRRHCREQHAFAPCPRTLDRRPIFGRPPLLVEGNSPLHPALQGPPPPVNNGGGQELRCPPPFTGRWPREAEGGNCRLRARTKQNLSPCKVMRAMKRSSVTQAPTQRADQINHGFANHRAGQIDSTSPHLFEDGHIIGWNHAADDDHDVAAAL